MTLLSNMFSDLADKVEGIESPFQERYANDPVGFAEDILQVELWSKQKDILLSVRDNKHTAASAAISTGKSFAAACVALWFFNTRPNSKIIVTAAPPERQIKDILFAEIRKLHRQATDRGVRLVGRRPQTMQIVADDNWWIRGFTIPQSGSKEERISKFHGHHAAGGVLVLGDEANGVPTYVHEAFENVTSAANCRVLLTSNPFVPSGAFWNATRDPDWSVVTISALEHPNVVTNETIIPGAIDRETTEGRIRKFTRAVQPYDDPVQQMIFEVPWSGEKRVVNNPIFCYKVLGTFPWEAEGALIPMSWFYRARQNYDTMMTKAHTLGQPLPPDLPDHPVCGLDVAEMGADFNAFVARYDNFLTPFTRWNFTEPNVTADRAARLCRVLESNRVNVDSIGVGADVAPLLRQANITAYGVKVSWSATRESEDFKYYRLRDQLGWEAREWFAKEDAAVPPDEEFEADCFAFEYEVTRSGIRITSKHKVKERLGRSPDAWDAFNMTFYEGGEKGRSSEGVGSLVLGRRR